VPYAKIIRSSLTLWTWEMKDATEARGQYVALPPVSERVLGPERAPRTRSASRRRWVRLPTNLVQ
jgi:hypothetical protein